MKNLIRTYVDPILEDRLKILAESSGVSLSALTAELIQKGLESGFERPADECVPAWLEELFYLQFLSLQIVLNSSGIEPEKFSALKAQSHQWAQQKSSSLNDQVKEG